MSALEPAKPFPRVAAAFINAAIIFGFALFAEWISATSSAPNFTARAYVAAQALFGISFIFWLICGQARSSPGLALMRLKLVQAEDPTTKPVLMVALLRTVPIFLVGAVLFVPTRIIPRDFASLHFILILIGSLFLAANFTPVWSGNERRSLLDKWCKVRVVKKA